MSKQKVYFHKLCLGQHEQPRTYPKPRNANQWDIRLGYCYPTVRVDMAHVLFYVSTTKHFDEASTCHMYLCYVLEDVLQLFTTSLRISIC